MDDYYVKHRYILFEITASGGERITARLLDIVIDVIILLPLIIWVFNQKETDLSNLSKLTTQVILVYSTIVNLTLEFIIPVLTKGKTLGKAALGLRMISDNGNNASMSRLFIRSLIYTFIPVIQELLSFGNLIGFIMFIVFIISLIFIFTDPYHQAVHDKLGKIYVVKDDLYQSYCQQQNEQIVSA